ncbi:MAG: hypothetical protein Q4E11_03335 [Corynebacterium sp.]|uniref:hypothetical protein n=1 Tax=Corynebacterium sp. TaxID=1720 RepID=UPI0026DBD2F0|nr:hypothetical protein [Corynebacterium sp.]MDO5029602.1 hypothetical protein [Corynebacterium sp.]
MTGPSSVDQGVRVENTVIVEMWLAAAEQDLATRIPGLLDSATQAKVEPLFVWSGLSMDEVERIDRFLGTLLAHHLAGGTDADVEAAKKVVDDHPLVTLASLVGRAARVASASDMWLDWPAALQLDAHAESTTALVEHIAAAVPVMLENAGLPNDVDSDQADADDMQRAAQVLLLHAGVQLSVMPLIIERCEELAGVGDLTEPSANDLVQALSKVHPQLEDLRTEIAESEDGVYPLALRQLAKSAPRQAHKLFKATLGYTIATAADPANWEAREEIGQLDAGLPPMLVAAAREELRLRPAGTPNRREAVGVVATTGRPQLYFDELTQTVGVQLPTPADPAGRTWRVTFGGTVATTPVVGLEDSAPRPVVTIDEPVRDVLVELGEDKHWRVPAISTADPILIFGADGQSVTDKVSLHSTSATVVYPVDATLVDPVTGAEVPMLSDPRPFNWELWQVVEIDLRDVHAVQVRRAGVAGEVRSASPQRQPRMTLPHARLDGTVSSYGTPVYAGGPVAVFPPTLSGNDESWRAIVTEFGGYGAFTTDSVMVYDLEVPAAGGEVDILTDDDYPWLGEFVVRLVNPRGRSFQKHFAIAEQADLTITYSGGGDGFRIPTVDGLSPADIRVVSGDKPLDAEPAIVRLGADELTGTLDLSTEEGAWLQVQVTPGTLQFEVPLSDETVARRTTTLVTRPRRIDAFGKIVVNAPGELRHAHIAVASGERDICRVPIRRFGDTGFAEFGKFADRVSLLKSLRISLDWTRVTGRKRLSVPLVEASSRDAIRQVAFNDEATDIIEIDVAAEAAHLPMTLWLWAAGEPWREPVALEVIEGECELPDELRGLGPFVAQVTLGVEKERHPQWPAAESAILHHVDDPEAIDVEAEDFDPVAYTAEAWGELGQDQLARLWTLLATLRAGRATSMPQANPLLSAPMLGAILCAQPRGGLAALNRSAIALDDQPGIFISSGLVLGDFSATKPVPGRRRVPWLGALAALADLTDESVDRSRQLEYLRKTGGQGLLDIAATGQDTTLESASIDQSSVQITALPEAQASAILSQVFDSYRMVPGPLTDDDARFTAIYEVVQNRAEIVESGVMTRLAAASRVLFKTVSKASPRLRKAVNVRFHKLDGIDADDPSLHWTLVPGTSLLIAVAARVLARSKAQNPDVSDAAVRELIPMWAQLADLVPTLVMSDILIADALVAHALHGDVTTLPWPEPEAEAEESEAAEAAEEGESTAAESDAADDDAADGDVK